MLANLGFFVYTLEAPVDGWSVFFKGSSGGGTGCLCFSKCVTEFPVIHGMGAAPAAFASSGFPSCGVLHDRSQYRNN